MATVMQLIRNGGQVIGDVEEIREFVADLTKENKTLKMLAEKQGAIIVSIMDEIGVISRKLDDIQDEVTVSKNTTEEIKHTKFYGQKPELLRSALERAEEMNNREIRKLIHRAAKVYKGGKRKGYTYIYNTLYEVTGYDVYEVGKVRLKKSDGIEGWGKDPSYINAILRDGKGEETAVICMQVLAEK